MWYSDTNHTSRNINYVKKKILKLKCQKISIKKNVSIENVQAYISLGMLHASPSQYLKV